MTDKSNQINATPSRYRLLGGRGLTSTLINEEVPATADALGPENKLVLAPGYLTATPLINTGRLSIGAKIPLEKRDVFEYLNKKACSKSNLPGSLKCSFLRRILFYKLVNQFTSNAFTQVLKDNHVAISMDGRDRCQDNISMGSTSF